MDASDWLRRPLGRLRTTRGDLLIAVAVTVLTLGDVNGETTRHPVVAAAMGVVAMLALAWRRRAPFPVVVGICLFNLYLAANTPGEFPPQLMFFGLLIAIYSAAAHTAGRAAVVAGTASFALVTAAHFVTPDGGTDDFLPYLVWGAPWLAGRVVRRQTLEAAASATRAAEVLRRREEELREARAQERDRIARELHDVVAHAVSLIVVQAGAERLRLGPAAPDTRGVLDAIETAGRQALGDLRTMLGLLRDGGSADGLAPQPQLSDLPALVERVRSAGLPVELELAGGPVPPALGLTAYRIVQEALTNVLKHAGPVPTSVQVCCADGLLRLDVTSPLPVAVPQQRAGGRGLLGMSERAALHGGSVVCGPEGAQWAVRAELPVATA